jgi:hypothetical protein
MELGSGTQITFLILYYISSRLLTLLEVIDALIQVPDIVDLTASFMFLNFSFQICLLFIVIYFVNSSCYRMKVKLKHNELFKLWTQRKGETARIRS